jgi:alpha-glucosidase (family GH31 glycosyl hydrolase)
MRNQVLKVCVALCLSACTIFGWTSGALTVTVTNSPMDINVAAGGKTLADITSLKFGTTSVSTISSVTSNTDSMVLTLNANYSLTIIGISGGLRFRSNNTTESTVMITLKDQNEHFYGITEQLASTATSPSPDLRGKTGFKDQVAAYQVSSGDDAEVYEGFYYTTLGYAGYFDSFAYGSYTFGVSGSTTITYNTSMINWCLFYGPKLTQIQQSFYKVIGAPKKVPMWACGPVVWHDNFPSSAAMIADADSFTTVKIPFSTLWLDRPYNNGTKGWGDMNFEGAFSSPDVWINTLATQYYVNLVTWIMPGCFSAPPTGEKYLTSTNYYFDLTDATTVAWYKNQLKVGQYAYGVKGHKMDRVDNGWKSGDGIVTLPAFSDGTLEPERHKKYAYLNCKITDDALRSASYGNLGDDQFNFPRCAVGGCQQYVSALWNGDTDAGYSGLLVSLGTAIRAGFLGFPMWGSDIGGYNAKNKVDITNLCRWMMFGVYSGFMEFMIDFKGPWIYTATEQASIQNIFNQRFNLLPYIYSIINTAATTGVTMRPLVGEYPGDAKTDSLVDEYMFGPAMLVAPLTSDLATRSLYLPAGTWINAWNYSDVQTGGATITSPTMSLTQIPVYIKSNSIYPTGKVFAGLEKKWNPNYDANRNLAINVFPGAAGESNSFTYVDYIDGDKQKTLTVSVSASNAITVTSPAMTIADTVYIRLSAAPSSVYSGSTLISSPQYNTTTKKLAVGFLANQPVSLTVNGTTKVLEPFEPLQAHGRMMVKHTNRGMELTIPRMTGIAQNSRATVAIYDMAGKSIVTKECMLNQYDSTPMTLALAKGSYIAKMEINGLNTGNVKVVVP